MLLLSCSFTVSNIPCISMLLVSNDIYHKLQNYLHEHAAESVFEYFDEMTSFCYSGSDIIDLLEVIDNTISIESFDRLFGQRFCNHIDLLGEIILEMQKSSNINYYHLRH